MRAPDWGVRGTIFAVSSLSIACGCAARVSAVWLCGTSTCSFLSPMADELDAALRDAKHASLSLFARRVSHDLNNFATVIRTYTELLMADVPPGSQYDDLGEIHRAADTMVSYLRHISHFSRSDARSSRVDVDAAVAGQLEVLQRDEPGAPVFIDGGSGACVQCDATRFAETVRELVRNAREASPADRPVVVRLFEGEPSWVTLRVSDEGPGFAAAIDDIAEDPFVTTKEGIRGAGFGLTLASVFASRAGGRLVRERVGERTHVSVWLPTV